MLFDIVFVAVIALQWLATFLLFLLKKPLVAPQPTGVHKFLKTTFFVYLLFLGVIILKLAHLVSLMYSLNHKVLSQDVFLRLLLYVAWQISAAALIFWLLMQLNLKKSYLNRFAISLSKKIFAALVFVNVWDSIGSIVLYLLLLSALLTTGLSGAPTTFLFQEPTGQWWILSGLLIILFVLFLSFWMLRKNISQQNLVLYGLSYLLLLVFSLFTVFRYRLVIFPEVGQVFTEFYLFLGVFFWVLLFVLSAVLFTLLFQLYRNKKYLKSELEFQFLIYHLSQLQLLSSSGLVLMVLIPVVFFIYF